MDEVLHTNFCLVEPALSSRPLTPVRFDLCNLNAFRPSDFLFAKYSSSIPSLVGDNEFHQRKCYARAQLYANAVGSGVCIESEPTL